MKVVVLTSAGQTARAIQDLLKWAKSIDFAYAWMTEGSIIWSPAWLKKISAGVVGISGAQTSVRTLERFFKSGSPVRMKDGDHPLFHPKMIVGCRGNDAKAVLGSSNFTNGGLCDNIELNVQLIGKRDDDEIAQLLSMISSWSKHGSLAITRKRLDDYRKRSAELARLRRRPGRVLQGGAGIFEWSWAEYFNEISHRHEPGKLCIFEDTAESPVGSYIGESKYCQKLLAEKSLRLWPAKERAYVAGYGGGAGYFCRTVGARDFKQMVASDADPSLRQLSHRLDQIPHGDKNGTINLARAEAVSSQALQISGVGLGCWTRLLVAKRPDVFLPINKGNKAMMRKELGPVPTTVSDYFRLLRRLHESPWFRAESPGSGKQRDVWDRRVALLDAVLYKPG
jgi:hypothetical protein